MHDYFYRTAFKQGSYQELLALVKFLRNVKGLSVFNSVLIFCQRPGAIWVETEAGWNRRGRYVKPEARPLVILQPFSPINFVYELEDTYGESFEYYKDKCVEDMPISVFDSVNIEGIGKVLNGYHILLSKTPLGSLQSGFISVMHTPVIVKQHDTIGNIKEIATHYNLIVNSNKPVPIQFITIIHELGHLFCGHLAPIKDAPSKETVRLDRSNLNQAEKETEAETVVKFVCARLHIEYDEQEYLSYYKENGRSPDINLEVVVTATDKVLNILSEMGIYAKN